MQLFIFSNNVFIKNMKELFSFDDLDVYHNEPLKLHSTYKIGAEAKVLVVPKTMVALKKVLDIVKASKVPHLVIGQGSNILFPDEPLNQVVIKINPESRFLNYINTTMVHGKECIEAGAGTTKEKLVTYSFEHSLTGFEFLSGIPGTLGGGIKMNAGTSDGKYEDIVKSFTTINLAGKLKNYTNARQYFSYRKLDIPDDEIIINITFFARKGIKDKIKEKIDDIRDLRRHKHPLHFPNCGSVFKNPPHIPAGLLIEKNKLKGYTVGDAQVSDLHGNFIVNLGNATAKDVKAVIEHVKNTIMERENILLHEEVIIVENKSE